MINEEKSDKNVANTKEDIEIIRSMIEEYENCSVPEVDMQINVTFRERQANALENILAEREQDKKRIQELEEENKKYIVKLTDEQYRKLVDSIRKEVKQEFEQKVKDKMEELKQLKVQLPVQHMKEAQIIVLQELLRGEEDNGT